MRQMGYGEVGITNVKPTEEAQGFWRAMGYEPITNHWDPFYGARTNYLWKKRLIN